MAAVAEAQIRPPFPRPPSRPTSRRPTAKAAPAPKVHLALVGGDVWNPTGAWLRDATVLLAGDRIAAVGTDLRIPEKVKRIDCRGKRLTPGFIALRGSTFMVLTGSGKIQDRLNPYDPDMELALAGGVTAVHISAGSTTSVVRLARGGLDHMLGRTDVTARLAYVNSSGMERAKVREGLRAARKYLRDLAKYEAAKKAGKKLPTPRPPSAAARYLPFVKDRRIARMFVSTVPEIIRACELAEEFDLRVLFEGVTEGWAVAGRIARAKAACIITPRDVEAQDRDLMRPSGSHPRLPGILRDAGVRLGVVPPSARVGIGGIAGSDLTTIALSAAFAVRGGLTETEALRALTIDAARCLGIDDETGTIVPGKWADIVIHDGDPLDYRTYPVTVVVAGRVRYEKSKSPLFRGTTAGDAPIIPPRPDQPEAGDEEPDADASGKNGKKQGGEKKSGGDRPDKG